MDFSAFNGVTHSLFAENSNVIDGTKQTIVAQHASTFTELTHSLFACDNSKVYNGTQPSVAHALGAINAAMPSPLLFNSSVIGGLMHTKLGALAIANDMTVAAK